MSELDDAAGGSSEDEELPETIEPVYAEFLVGFPCTQFGCPGVLERDGRPAYSAVVCSVCEHVYYLVSEQ